MAWIPPPKGRRVRTGQARVYMQGNQTHSRPLTLLAYIQSQNVCHTLHLWSKKTIQWLMHRYLNWVQEYQIVSAHVTGLSIEFYERPFLNVHWKFEPCSKYACWWYTGCVILHVCINFARNCNNQQSVGSDPTIDRSWDFVPLFTESGILSHCLQTLGWLSPCLQTLGFYRTDHGPWDFIPLFTDPGILSYCLQTQGFYPTVYRPWDFILLFTDPGILLYCFPVLWSYPTVTLTRFHATQSLL